MRVAIAVLAFIAACVPDPVEPGEIEPVTTMLYSSQDDLIPIVGSAMELINQVAGCELVALVSPGEFVIDIVSVEEHINGDNILGCAFMDSALYPEAHAPDLIVDSVVTAMTERGASVLMVHELGHTLGLSHSDGLGFMYFAWRNDGDFFDAEGDRHLRDLCAEQRYWKGK